MFDLYGTYQANIMLVSTVAGTRQYDPGIAAVSRAVSRYHSLVLRAHLRRLWASITRSSVRLLDLDGVRRSRTVEGIFDLGCATIAVERIRGSECRVCDFDDAFLPLNETTRQRWVSVYAARLCGDSLPAVSVVQVGDIYYVRDGHHRISVARVLGEEYIDANVQVWQVKGEAALSPATGMRLVVSV